jgi:hypothetical protein
VRRDSKSLLTAFRIWLVLAGLVLAGCSTGIRLGYSYADTLVVYSIDEYVGLTPEQELLVKERAGALLAWHRSTQLRDYAQLIETARRKLEGRVTAADVLAFNQAVAERMVVLGDRAAPDLARLALSLTPDQIARMERKLDRDNSKAREELAQFTGAASLEERVKKYAERAEFWFGRVSSEQLEIVRASLVQRPAAASWWIDERARRQREMVTVLQRIRLEQPSETIASSWVRAYFARLRNPADPARRREVEEFRLDSAELVAQLINSASADQKAALSRRLGDFAEDFVALASGRGPLSPG